MTTAILFDLDGTFADTAPDLAYAVNRMRAARGLPPVPLEATRPYTSSGARGVLGAAFGVTPEHADYAAMREEFIALYRENLCRETRLFPGIAGLIDAIDARGLRWGIVTNKAEGLARPLLERLDVAHRAACLIGGDTTGQLKPHPAPLLAAARALGVEPAECLYVGDDRRDIDAGRAAGMRTAAVTYGYLNGSVPATWGADALVDHPVEIEKIILKQ